MITNNVTRFLSAKKVNFESFELPKEKLGALKTADILGVNPETVFKSIVILRTGKGKPILAIVPGTHEADLKNIAKVVDEKKVLIPTQAEAEKLTGLQAGGISPFALINKGFQFLLAEESRQFEKIYLSGGQRGLSIYLAVEDIVQLIHPKVDKISHPLDESL